MAYSNNNGNINEAPRQETENNAFVLSRDPNRAMQQMMETIDQLRTIYEEENQALNAADTQRFLGLQDRKIHVARKYQKGAQQLLDRKSDLQHIDIALKEELNTKQSEFSGLMTENLRALERMQKGVKKLNEKIMNTAREAVQQKNVNYGAEGHLNKNRRPVSIGVSESA